MIRAQYSLIAEIVRQGTVGKIDFLGVFDRIYVRDLPAIQPSLYYVVLLVAESEDDLGKKSVVISLADPSGQKIFEQRGEVQIKPTAGTWFATTQIVLQLNGLPLPTAGRYTIQVQVDNKEVARNLLSVVKQPPPQ